MTTKQVKKKSKIDIDNLKDAAIIVCTDTGYKMVDKPGYLFGTTDISVMDIVEKNNLKEELLKKLAAHLSTRVNNIRSLCRLTIYDNSLYIQFKKDVLT